MEDEVADWVILLKRILKKLYGRVWSAIFWLKVGTNNRLVVKSTVIT